MDQKYYLKKELITLPSNMRMHKLDIPVVGLTGGMACGKSTVASFFQKKGLCVIDADKLIKRIYAQKETLEFVQSVDPQSVITKDMALSIDFKKLRESFFHSKDLQNKIENFLYPQLKHFFLLDFEQQGGAVKHGVIVYDVPLLFEKNLDVLVDVSICVYCPRSQQKERLIRRDAITAELADTILNNQMDIEEKKNRSDFIINNIGDFILLESECQRILQEVFIAKS